MAGHRDFARDLTAWAESKPFFGAHTWAWTSRHGTPAHPDARVTYTIKQLGANRFEVTFNVREPGRTFRGLLGPDGVVLHQSRFAFPTPQEAAMAAHYHHVRNFHEELTPAEVWPFGNLAEPHEVTEGITPSEVWPRGQRRWDPNVNRCRADSKYIRVKDGKKQVLSRGRFVNCVKQARAAGMPRDGKGHFGPGAVVWPQQMLVGAAYPGTPVLIGRVPSEVLAQVATPAPASAALPPNRPKIKRPPPTMLPGFLGKPEPRLGRRDHVKPRTPTGPSRTPARDTSRSASIRFVAPDRTTARRQLDQLKQQASQGLLPVNEVNAVIKGMNRRWGLDVALINVRGRRDHDNEHDLDGLDPGDLDAAIEALFTASGGVE